MDNEKNEWLLSSPVTIWNDLEVGNWHFIGHVSHFCIYHWTSTAISHFALEYEFFCHFSTFGCARDFDRDRTEMIPIRKSKLTITAFQRTNISEHTMREKFLRSLRATSWVPNCHSRVIFGKFLESYSSLWEATRQFQTPHLMVRSS